MTKKKIIKKPLTSKKISSDVVVDYKKVFYELNNGLVIHDKGVIVDVNEAFAKIFGYERQELLGISGLSVLIPPQSQAKVSQKIKVSSEDSYETMGLKKDGTMFPLKIIASTIKFGTKELRVAVLNDVSIEKKIDDKIKISEERYRILYESSRDAIMTLEPPTWVFTSGNKAALKMFGYASEGDFTSATPMDLSPKIQPDTSLSSIGAKKMINIALKKGSHEFEWVHRRKNGQEFDASVLLTRVDLGGKRFLQATVRDISKRKEAEKKLYIKMEELEKFNKLMVGRELKMAALKKEINLKKNK